MTPDQVVGALMIGASLATLGIATIRKVVRRG